MLPSGQNAHLRSGIEKETEGVTLVSTGHSASQFPLRPYIQPAHVAEALRYRPAPDSAILT